MLSRKPSTALSGTSTERKASASSTSAMPTITATNGGRAWPSLVETSMLAAVVPVTAMSAPVADFNSARRSRISLTSVLVSGWSGPVCGMTGTRAVRPSSSSCGGSSVRTPFRVCSSPATACTACSGRGAPWASTTTTSGALKPGPKPSLTRSYALRASVPTACEPPPGRPRSRLAAGTARVPSPARPMSRTGSGRRTTKRAQRSPMVVLPLVRSARFQTGSRSMARPTKPSTAGSSVIATRTATTTAPEAARPITVRNGTPATASPASATTTVRPAKTTALPAVAVARRRPPPVPGPRRGGGGGGTG